ncbi:LOW QUALITY PROTEIN: probable G-protein coupled receptor No18 [Amphiura filiformis]|uniref:LOW QUALITY PROTEIN: probable G-protein coupled receptor No18 n=1 Tax=Amphiura filiformis TaxID=82378 RepID=UPI003B221F35
MENRSNQEVDDEGSVDKPIWAAVIILPILIVFGLVGNSLICVAVFKFRRLHKVPNYFIVSLAVADLIVCGGIMPFGLYQQIHGGYWLLGVLSCRIFTSFDVVTATASIWNLCVISIDRYMAVTKPVWYSTRRTTRTALMSILAAWFLSTVLAILPAILIEGLHTDEGSYACVPEKDTAFLLMSSTFVFYIPCIVTISFPEGFESCDCSKQKRIAPSVDNESQNSRISRINVSNAQEVSLNSSTVHRDVARAESGVSSAGAGNSDLANAVEGRNSISLAGEKKTLTVLLVVLGCFILCWLPFFIFLTSQGLCTSCAMTPTAFHAVRWLGLCNSVFNPVLYSIFNRDFRNAFKRILLCRK